MKNSSLFYIVVMATIIYSCKEPEFSREPVFVLGGAEVTVRINGSQLDTEHFKVYVEPAPVYSGFMDYSIFPLNQISNEMVYNGLVPLEQESEIVGFQVIGATIEFGFVATISQDSPTTIEINLTDDIESITTTQDEDIYQLDEISTCFLELIQSDNYSCAPESLYNDWKKVRAYEIQEVLPKYFSVLDSITIPKDVQKWFLNNALIYWAGENYIPFTARPKRFINVDVPSPPIEAWSWLDTLDYSNNMLKHLPYEGLMPFLKNILLNVGGGLTPIGETQVSVWKDYAAKTLQPAIKEPTDLLLDLLSGMSYILQITQKGQALSFAQLENIRVEYPDDLGLIIMQFNDKLRKGNDNIYDLSESDFSLIEYVNKEFPGQPVVVDLWNTWCGPCLNAIGRVGTIHDELPKDVVYLYISDVSSETREWQIKSREIQGVSVRINKDSLLELSKKFNLTGFPSYIFIDKNHNITYSGTGFMGLDRYKRMVLELAE